MGVGRAGRTGRVGETRDSVGRGTGPSAILTVPLLEAVLSNCDLVLGLKQRRPNPGLSACLPTSPPPWQNLSGSLGSWTAHSEGLRVCWAACPDLLQLVLTRSEVPGKGSGWHRDIPLPHRMMLGTRREGTLHPPTHYPLTLHKARRADSEPILQMSKWRCKGRKGLEGHSGTGLEAHLLWELQCPHQSSGEQVSSKNVPGA